MALRRTGFAPQPFERPLSFPRSDVAPRRADDAPAPHSPLAPIAIIWLCLTFLGAISGAFVAGREVEKGSQLGRILALSQELEVLEAVVARADSGWRMLERLTQGARMPQNMARMPHNQSVPVARPVSRMPPSP